MFRRKRKDQLRKRDKMKKEGKTEGYQNENTKIVSERGSRCNARVVKYEFRDG